MLFSLWVTFASGYQSVYQAMLLFLVGIPLYAFLKARRERLGLAARAGRGLVDARGRAGRHHVGPVRRTP